MTRYLSVCSGIEAATVAWHPLGWEPAAFAEILPHPSSVLEHHYPGVPNHGDFTTIEGDEYGTIELIVGGTPCQSFSIAGLRGGLDDDRGNLALQFCRLVDRVRPRWFVWENVPGCLSSSGGRDFGAILGAMENIGYGCAWRILDAEYVRVESHPRAVPQRRRRIFIVGYSGDWRPPTAVLLEPESVRGDNPPGRKAGEKVASTFRGRADGGGGFGSNVEEEENLLTSDVACTLDTSFASKAGQDNQHVDSGMPLFVPYVSGAVTANNGLRGDYPGASLIISESVVPKWATGRGGPSGHECQNLVAFNANEDPSVYGEKTGPLTGQGCQPMAVAFEPGVMSRDGGHVYPDVSGTIRAEPGDNRMTVAHNTFVRRITPLECERLMAFPDFYTDIPYNGKPMSDSARYRMLGNSMAVNVMRWIGNRINKFEEITKY